MKKGLMALVVLLVVLVSGCEKPEEKEDVLHIGILKSTPIYEMYYQIGMKVLESGVTDMAYELFTLDLSGMPLINEETVAEAVNEFVTEHDIDIVYSYDGFGFEGYVESALNEHDILLVSISSFKDISDTGLHLSNNLYEYGENYAIYVYETLTLSDVFIIMHDNTQDDFYQGFVDYATANNYLFTAEAYSEGTSFTDFATANDLLDKDAIVIASQMPFDIVDELNALGYDGHVYSDHFNAPSFFEMYSLPAVDYLTFVDLCDEDLSSNPYLVATSGIVYFNEIRAIVYDSYKIVFDQIQASNTLSARTLINDMKTADFSSTATHIISFDGQEFQRSYVPVTRHGSDVICEN